MLLPAPAASPEDRSRRSQRKTKRIDRDRFATTYSKLATPKRGRSAYEALAHEELQSFCGRLIATNRHAHQPFLLAQMQKALREQSSKLFSVCKIKLKLEEELAAVPQTPPSPAPVEPIQELPESESAQLDALEAESFPWQGLRRAESAKMLCDNYENHELVYSVETLTPRLAKEDLEFKFIEELQ